MTITGRTQAFNLLTASDCLWAEHPQAGMRKENSVLPSKRPLEHHSFESLTDPTLQVRKGDSDQPLQRNNRSLHTVCSRSVADALFHLS